MTQFTVQIFEKSYLVTATSRAKAVTEGIKKYKKDFPDSKVPLTMLRTIAKSFVYKPEEALSREDVENLYKEKVKSA